MMKRVLSILLAAVLLLSAFTVLPMTAGAVNADIVDTGAAEDFAPEAAEKDLADTGDRLGITVKYNSSDMSVDVSWNAISGATGYHLYLFNDDKDGKWLINNSQDADADVTSKHYDYYFFNTYSAGGMHYKFRITAYLPDHQSFYEEKEFQTGVPILDDPEGTLLPNGVFMLTKYSNKAKRANIHLKNQKGKSVSFTDRGIGDGIQDFSSAITPGNYYYVHYLVSATGYRDSQWIDTPQVKMRSDLMSISGLSWSDYKLSWTAYSTDPQTKYYYKLEQFSTDSGEWFDRGDFEVTTSTSHDFASVLSELPKAKYRVVIFALPGNGAPPSKVTISPELIYPLSYLSSAECTLDAPVGGANPDYTGTPVKPPAFLNAPFTTEVWYWYLDESPYPHLSETDTFTGGKTYAVRVKFMPEPGYEFNDDTVVKINGKTAYYVGGRAYETTFTAEQPQADTGTVYGTVSSFLDENEEVTIQLDRFLAFGSYSTTVVGNNTTFMIPNVKKGMYVYSISKKNHVTRVGTYTVGSLIIFYEKICPIGDVDGNGKVQAADAMKAYQHAQGKADAQITDDYAFKCADVAPIGDPNGKVQAADAMVIYQQAQGKHSLF